MDYRALLKKYMDHLNHEEGTTYVHTLEFSDVPLTDEEMAALREIDDELTEEWRKS